MSGVRTSDTRVGEIHHQVVKSTLLYIDANIGKRLTVAKLAAHAGYDVHYFTKFFTVIVGHPPGRYVAKRRMTFVKYLLEIDPTISLAAVAERVNYTQHNLERAFQRETGSTMSQWRNYVRRRRELDAAAAGMESRSVP